MNYKAIQFIFKEKMTFNKVFSRIVLISTALYLSLPISGQNFINGSFEPFGDPGCRENISNQTFNTLMPDVIALGVISKLDIYNSSCGKGFAVEGNYFLGIEGEMGTTDAIAIPLDKDLVPNKYYYIEFYARVDAETSGEYDLALGVNINPNSHGDLLYTLRDLPKNWQKYSLTFRTPIIAKYITVLVETRGKAKVYVDDFKFGCPPINLGRDTTYCTFQNRKLEVNNSYSNILWNDGSSERILNATVPGVYSIEANFGNCIIYDTIRLVEDPTLCACKVFLPNVFAPGSRPPNNTFKVTANCDVKEFLLEIYDRWGNIVFQSKDPSQVWDGTSKTNELSSGLYICKVTYLEDIVNKKMGQEISTLTIIR